MKKICGNNELLFNLYVMQYSSVLDWYTVKRPAMSNCLCHNSNNLSYVCHTF